MHRSPHQIVAAVVAGIALVGGTAGIVAAANLGTLVAGTAVAVVGNHLAAAVVVVARRIAGTSNSGLGCSWGLFRGSL